MPRHMLTLSPVQENLINLVTLSGTYVTMAGVGTNRQWLSE